MRIAGLLAAAAISLASLAAHADNARAWSAARAGLPSDAKLVVSVDFAALQKTQVFATYYAKLIEKADAATLVEALKAGCKLDPLAAVQGIVVAMTADQEDGAAYIALNGVDKARLSSCVQLAVQGAARRAADGSDAPVAKATIKHDGSITEISNGKDSAYFGWIGKDVVVVPIHTSDRAAVTRWMSGKGALGKSELGKSIGKLNTSAALWGAGEATKELQPGVTMTRGYGALTFAKGSVGADVHAVVGSADQATAMAAATRKQLDEAKQGLLPPAVAAVLGGVSIGSAADEVVVKATMVEKDLISVLALALGGAP